MTDLKSRLEAVKELKREYGIGSDLAHKYLKAHSEFSALRDEIVEELKNHKVNYSPSVREISNVCDTARHAIQDLVDLVMSDPEYNIRRYSKTLESSYSHSLHPDDLVFDYNALLLRYFKMLDSTKDPAISLMFSISHFIDSDHPYLCDGRDKLSFSSLRNGKPVKDISIISGKIEDFNPGSVTDEERKFLMHSKTNYERAIKEKTLYRLETTRRIALNEMTMWTEGDNIEERIKGKIENLKRRIAKCSDRIRQLTGFSGAGYLIGNDKHMIEEYRYKIRAIVENKKWLEKILSN